MNQNSNFLIQPDDLMIKDPVLTIGNVNFWAILDSENRIYQFKYLAPKPFWGVLNFFGTKIIDQKIDDLENNLKTLFQNPSNDRQIKLFEPGYLYIKNLIKYLKQGVSTRGSELQFICLCSQITEARIYQSYLENKGDIRLIKKQTDLTMKCGGCEKSFLRLVKQWEKNSSFYNGQELTDYIDKLKTILEEFHSFTSIDLTSFELKKIYFREGYFNFELINYGDDVVERSKLETSLINFYASKLDEKIPILVTIFN